MIGPNGSYIIIDTNPPKQPQLNIDNKIERLKLYPHYKQKSTEWLEQRKNYICGSEAAALLGLNIYETQYNGIKKKLIPTDVDYSNMVWGNATEKIIASLYEYLMNVKINEYGLIPHPTYNNIGASPDGIVGKFTREGNTISPFYGRLVEIKSLVKRKISVNPKIKKDIVPSYYIPQVLQQLESCDLYDCDVFQVKVSEYGSWKEFIGDSSTRYTLSKDNKFKSIAIQLLPKDTPSDINTNEINKISTFISLPNIDTSNIDLINWCKTVQAKLSYDYLIYKFIYCKIEYGRCTNIQRNTDIFNSYIPVYNKMWEYITILRESNDKRDIFIRIIDYYENLEGKRLKYPDTKKKLNTTIMNILDDIVRLINNKETIYTHYMGVLQKAR